MVRLMLIQNQIRVQRGVSERKTASVRQSGGGFSALLGSAEETPAAAGSGPPPAIGGVGTLLLAQAVDDRPERRAKSMANAHEMLDILEAIRRGLILGTLPVERLRHLAALGNQQPSGDARLDGLIAEIQLRAAVELAKLGFDV